MRKREKLKNVENDGEGKIQKRCGRDKEIRKWENNEKSVERKKQKNVSKKRNIDAPFRKRKEINIRISNCGGGTTTCWTSPPILSQYNEMQHLHAHRHRKRQQQQTVTRRQQRPVINVIIIDIIFIISCNYSRFSIPQHQQPY